MKKIIAMLLSGVLALSLFGCGTGPIEGSASGGISDSVSSGEAAARFPVTVTDAAGRQVTIAKEPETLISGYYITTSMLVALGQQDKLVGVEAKASSRPIYALAAPEVLALPSVGTAKEFDLEGCAALKPDLVILPLKLKDTVPALEALGLTVLTADPEDLERLDQTVEMLGRATGAVREAEALRDDNAKTQAELAKLLGGVERPTVYLAGNSSYLNTAGAKMYQNTLIDLGGGVNVAAELEDDYWARVSYEQLLAWDPDVIVMAPGASYRRDDLMSDPQLAGLSAVKNGRVYAMPDAIEAWDSPVPSALMGSRWMAAVLHAELYAFDAFQEDAAEFYHRFYGVEIDKDLLTK